MPLEPAITDIEQLKTNPALAALLDWKRDAIEGAKWDRDEMTIFLERAALRDACRLLRTGSTDFNFLADVTCVDLYPTEPRFEVKYHLLSQSRKERLRLTVRLNSEDANVESLYPLWPACDFFEREVFDLFGVRFLGHPNLIRIMMPDDWVGHPMRKDYPVEGYR
ncbi:MAG: NADH-quinone oxidoreductase subunit C [Acidobacteriaceae bacterium]